MHLSSQFCNMQQIWQLVVVRKQRLVFSVIQAIHCTHLSKAPYYYFLSHVGSFIKIWTSLKIRRIYLVWKPIKIPFQWGVNQLFRVRNKKVMAIYVPQNGPYLLYRICTKNCDLVLAFCVYRHCIWAKFSTWWEILQKCTCTSWYLTVTSWNLGYQRIDNFFRFALFKFGVKNG